MENYDLKKIKKQYGENFAKLCRKLFPTILEYEGELYSIITSSFSPTRSLYNDIINNELTEPFKNSIFSKFNVKKEKTEVKPETKSPYELMEKAGYKLYKCETEEDMLAFRKYWKYDEELCTFDDPDRINSHVVYFAVKENAKKLKREDYKSPLRQDEYGTSVISIQISKGHKNSLSIKNRYNHSVNNPDSTFSNDLDNIYPGLTDSFIKECKLDFSTSDWKLEIPHYVADADGKLYKYNIEINYEFYCENNIFIGQDRVAKQYRKDRFELIEQFLLDKQENKITNLSGREDSFVDLLQNIQKIEVIKVNENKEIIITTPEGKQKIIKDQNNAIVGYENINAKKINKGFLAYNKKLKIIKLTNVEVIGDFFLVNNQAIDEIHLPRTRRIGNSFLYRRKKMTKVDFPSVERIGNNFMYENLELEEISAPKAISISNCFLACNKTIKKIDMSRVSSIGCSCLSNNKPARAEFTGYTHRWA